MDASLNQYRRLRPELVNFALAAEGDLATALERYTANQALQWSKTKLNGLSRTDLAVDMFLTEGRVSDRSVIDCFIYSHPDLSEEDRVFLQRWHRSFNGLFEVQAVTPTGYELFNWLTAQRYRVRPSGLEAQERLERLQPKEIIVTRLQPITQTEWTFSGPMLLLGKLGKPKLAVAVGNFKDWFPQQLYGDAPDLLEAAWESVERYHRGFVDFFGGDQVTLSGYELSKKLQAYQEQITEQKLTEAGLDASKSLSELVADSGVEADEVVDSVAEMGEDAQTAKTLLSSRKALKMMMPPIELPPDLMQAEAVTVLVHPRWGQTFLKDYSRFRTLLSTADEENHESLDQLTRKYLNADPVNAYIWHHLAATAPEPLEASLQRVTANPDFTLESDLDPLLRQQGKPLEPSLPEIASVPSHLHDLFQEALQEVNQRPTKKKAKKAKAKRKASAGFGG